LLLIFFAFYDMFGKFYYECLKIIDWDFHYKLGSVFELYLFNVSVVIVSSFNV